MRILLASGLCLALTFAAFAGADDKAEHILKKIDKDSDGKVSLDEFKARGGKPERAEKLFKKADKNGDGFLTAEEFQDIAKNTKKKAAAPAAEAKPATPESGFKQADKNSDGKLDADEFKATQGNPKKAEAHFKMADKNSDSFLSPAEFDAIAAAMAKRAAKMADAKPNAPQPTSPKGDAAKSDAQSKQPAVVEGLRNSDRDPLKVVATIDKEIDKKLAEKKIPASPMSSDAEFIRRLSLDIRGRIPSSAETDSFLKDQDAGKRRKLIDEYLADPEYGEHFAIIWYRRMVKPDADNRAVISTNFRDWLADRYNQNQGWDRMVADILTASGDRDQNPATVFWLGNSESKGTRIAPNKVTTAASQLFLGVKLECCECHNHPFDKGLKQEDFWSVAAFFTATHTEGGNKKAIKQDGVVPAIYEDNKPVKLARKDRKDNKGQQPAGTIEIPESKGKTVTTKFLLEDGPVNSTGLLRPAFATWLTSPQNPYFAKAAANRLWANFFGRGIIDPADDLRSTEGPTHPEVLDALAAEMVASNFDLKHLIRCVCNSNAYQRSSLPLTENKDDDELYSHMPLRMMSADMLYDSLTVALDHEPAGGGQAPGKKGNRERRGKKPREEFLAYFHAEADDDANILEPYTHGIPQVLRLMNSDELNNTDKVVTQLVQNSQGPQQVIESIYLRVLSRKPTESEIKRMQQYLSSSSENTKAAGELMWALLNSSEFLFNH